MQITILTGAGISAESGLGTFRDREGLWSQVNLEDVATPEGFARDPAKVHAFYNHRREGLLAACPNAAHEALARLGRALGRQLILVTQNIDDLHERAGSPSVIHMHGELLSALCDHCDHRWHREAPMSVEDSCTACAKTGGVRPDVVWFGEMPYRMDEISEHLVKSDLFVAIGTSGQVYPAAGFVAEAKLAGARTIEINLEQTDHSGVFDRHILGPASKVVPSWVEEVLGQG